MRRHRYTAEQIIGKLREAEVALSKGQTVLQVCRPSVIRTGDREYVANLDRSRRAA